MTPSRTAPENGSKSQYCRSTGTTSVWLRRINGGLEPSPGSVAVMFIRSSPNSRASDASKDAGEPLAGGALAARRVGGVDADELREELGRLFGDRVPVDLRRRPGHASLLSLRASLAGGSVG